MPRRARTISSRKKSRPACSAPRRRRASSSSASTTATTRRSRSATPTSWCARKSISVIEFQTDEHVAPIVAAKYREAGIPLIAIEVPHPGATYFGANNYEAGLIGGRHLGRWAKQQRYGGLDEIVFIALDRAGSLPRMRLTGMLVGMKEIYPALENCRVTYLDGDGKLGESFEAMRRHLRSSRARGFLIGAINDPSALGALRAMQEAGRIATAPSWGRTRRPKDARSCASPAPA